MARPRLNTDDRRTERDRERAAEHGQDAEVTETRFPVRGKKELPRAHSQDDRHTLPEDEDGDKREARDGGERHHEQHRTD
jgi:hypothetical protein